VLASREICIMLPVDVAVLDVCNCAFGLVPMSQGGFSGLPLESSRHREILGRSGRWSGVGGVAAAVRASSPIFIPPTAVRASSKQRERRNNTPTPKYHRPSVTTTAPPSHPPNTTNAAPPRPPGESPPRLYSASFSRPGRACAFPTPAAPSHMRREHTPTLYPTPGAASTLTH